MKLKEVFTEFEREEMVRFANNITPFNWNVFESYDYFKETPGTLNIHLDIRDLADQKDDRFHAMLHGEMSFREKVAKVHVVLQPYIKPWRPLIVHEFAHVAVYRWIAFETKVYNKPMASVGLGRCVYFDSIPTVDQPSVSGKIVQISKDHKIALLCQHGKAFHNFEKQLRLRWRRLRNSATM